MAVTSFFSAFIVYKHISFISFTGILQNLPKNFTTVLSVVKFCSILCEIITISGGIYMSIVSDIEKLKKEKNAVILAHYYVDEDVQDVADYIGDSFYLSKVATKVSQDRIIFAGVEFMGESAKILNPKKRVFMPDMNADCPMAHMADKDEILALREKYNDLAVVCYINSTAELKKYSDVCVTSSNAVKIVKNLPNKNIFFIPDRNLGSYVAKQCPDKNFIFNNGCCPRHVVITKDMVLKAKELHPEARFAAHPECTEDVLQIMLEAHQELLITLLILMQMNILSEQLMVCSMR